MRPTGPWAVTEAGSDNDTSKHPICATGAEIDEPAQQEGAPSISGRLRARSSKSAYLICNLRRLKKGPRQRSLHEALLQLLHCIIVGAELRILRDHARHVGREARRTMHVSRSVLVSVCASAHAFATLSKARCAERPATSY